MKRYHILLLSILIVSSSTYGNGDLQYAKPEEVGMSSERLKHLHNWMEGAVESYPLTGAMTLVAREGKIADWRTYGYKDKLKGLPMEKDTIFRLHSMTKPIASAAAMMLIERGMLELNDPVVKHLPEFPTPEVYITAGWNRDVTRPAHEVMRIRHLLTHTAGFHHSSRGHPDLVKKYQEADLGNSPSLDVLIERLAKIPLCYDPGTVYEYSISIDVLGAVIQRVSGKPFDVFLQEEIFDPLGMKDTFFEIPANKRDRLIPGFKNVNGQLAYDKSASDGSMRRPYPSGSGGLYSTVEDYFHFAQMLLNFGSYNGKSLLGRKTVEAMMKNQLGFLETPRTTNASEGFGFGGSVKVSDGHHNQLSSIGTFGWGGAGTTWFRIDPSEDLLVMFFTQHYPMASRLTSPFMNTSIQAVVD